MAKIQANAPGLHTITHDYNRSPLGKFGDRDVQVGKSTVHYRSSKTNAFKQFLSKAADLLPGNNGKVRSFNRTQKEFSRQIGNTLGRLAKEDISDDNLADLGKLAELGEKMEGKVAGFDAKAAFSARLGQTLPKMTSSEFKQVRTTLDQLDLVPPQPTGDQAVDQENLQAFQKNQDLLTLLKDAVVDERANRIVSASGTAITSADAKEIMSKVTDGKKVAQWAETGIRLPALSSYLTSGMTPQEASAIIKAGKSITDFTQLKGPPLNLPDAVAVDCLKKGIDAAAIQALVNTGVSTSEAIEYAQAGCTAAQKQALEQQGLVKGEIIGLVSTGIANADAIQFGAFRSDDVDPASITAAKGGACSDVFKVDVDRGNGIETMFFSRSQATMPDNAHDIFKDIDPDLTRNDLPLLANRNVASSKLDRLLGANILAETDYASLEIPTASGGTEVVVGTAMKKADGKAIQDVDVRPKGNWQTADARIQGQLDNQHKGDLASFNKAALENGFVGRINPQTNALELSLLENIPHNIPINDPDLRFQSILLQYIDVLGDQADRSPGNYFVGRDANGKVKLTGIDNDLAWGTYPDDRAGIDEISDRVSGRVTLKGLPPIADQRIIQMFTGITPQDLNQALGLQLNQKQLAAAGGRLLAIQQHLQSLAPNQIVANWGPGADAIFQNDLNSSNCYLLRDEEFFLPPS